MNQKLRVLLFSVAYPGEAGGVQGVVNRLAAALRRNGHAVTKSWAAPNPDASAGDLTFTLAHFEESPRSMLRVGRDYLRLARALRRLRPQIVNIHFASVEAVHFLRLRPLLRYKLVLSVHGSDILRPNERDARHLPRLLRRADAITAVTSLLAERVKAFPGVDSARVHLITNGVDFNFWSTVTREKAQEDPPTVLSLGRMMPVKGQDVLLEAFALVRDRHPQARLILIGDGPARQEFEQLAARLGIADAVDFVGQRDPDDVRIFMGRTAVFALPSRSEGLPLALLEAMAAGLPVVATRVGGVPDVLEPGTGLLVPPEDAAALAEALSKLLDRPAEAAAMGERARERTAGFSAAAADAAYETLFQALHAR